MRMWMIDPAKMCRQHLLGEHNELHKLAGALKKGKRLNGYFKKGLLEPLKLVARHQELVTEMHKRGYNHQSP